MLYVFHGDPKAVIEKVEGTIASLSTKNRDAAVVRVEEEGVGTLGDMLFEQGLFKSTYIVYINAMSSEVLREYIFENVETLKESPHLILLSLTAAKNKTEEKELAELEKVASKMQKCVIKNTEVEPPYIGAVVGAKLLKRDPFAITDSLLKKDKLALFVELEHARLSGERAEEVVGVLFWAAKSMALAGSAKSAAEAGLKPYPYQKAKEGYAVWGKEGADELVFTLATLSTKAYADGEEVYAALERVCCG